MDRLCFWRPDLCGEAGSKKKNEDTENLSFSDALVYFTVYLFYLREIEALKLYLPGVSGRSPDAGSMGLPYLSSCPIESQTEAVAPITVRSFLRNLAGWNSVNDVDVQCRSALGPFYADHCYRRIFCSALLVFSYRVTQTKL